MFKSKRICLTITTVCLFLLVCLSGTADSQPPNNGNNGQGQNGRDTSDRPAWKQTYLAKYNTTSQSVTNECGKHYASKLLENLFKLQPYLKGLCEHDVKVQVYVVARVVIVQGQVQLNTYLNATSTRANWNVAKRDIDNCADFLENELDNLETIEGTSWLRDVNIRDIPAEGLCSAATLDGDGFRLLDENWTCAQDYYLTLDPPPERCHFNGSEEDDNSTTTTTQTEPPALTSTTSVTSQCENAGSCVDTLRNELKQSTFCPVMVSLSACVDMYSTDEAEKEACYRKFNDLRREHESATNMSCDDFTTPEERATTSSQNNQDITTAPSPTRASTAPPTAPPTTGVENTADLKYYSVSQFWKVHASISSPLVLSEGGNNGIIRMRTEVGQEACADNPNTCDIYLQLQFTEDTSPKCRSDKKPITQIVVAEHEWAYDGDFCSVHLTPDRLNKTMDIPIRAVVDFKYDGEQTRVLNASLTRVFRGQGSSSLTEVHFGWPIFVEDRDRKATCQSINDPHVTTFDSLQYNNFFEGEFCLYKHTHLPFRVHAIYQRCGPSVNASCNCGVAVQSGDDVLVIERCFRNRVNTFSFPGASDPRTDVTQMKVQVFRNGDFTPGTKIHSAAEGRKYFIYLPTGTYVKVQVSGELVNIWIVASPNDLNKTEGLCGVYNGDVNDDVTLRNGIIDSYVSPPGDKRGEPRTWIQDWRVDLNGPESIFQGVPASVTPYEPTKYCECQGQLLPKCGYAIDISTCDILEGTDVTEELLAASISPVVSSGGAGRRKRQVSQNNVINAVQGDPIKVDQTWTPPPFVDMQNEVNKNFCEDYLHKNYTVGKLCSAFPGVNIDQEVQTCTEDIQLSGSKKWAPSARSALNEQCLEEIQRNGSISDDVANQIGNSICVNSCSGHGQCVNAHCMCEILWTSSDCSVSLAEAPYISDIPGYGLCNVQMMDCSKVFVYGNNFVDSTNLTCFLQEYDFNTETAGQTHSEKAIFVNFNSVECPINHRKSYLVYISNDGNPATASNPLPFIPYDGSCMLCSLSQTADKVCEIKEGVSACLIDSWCYLSGASSPDDECSLCQPFQKNDAWTVDGNCSLDNVPRLPDWLVAVIAAVAGSIVGILVGFSLYWCCCKRKSFTDSDDFDQIPVRDENNLQFHPVAVGSSDPSIYHRNPRSPYTRADRLHEVALRQPEYERTYFHNDGRGVENGVNDSTYF